MNILPIYRCPHRDMIAGAFQVVDALEDHLEGFLLFQERWNKEYCGDLKLKIRTASSNNLGVDYVQMMENTTDTVEAIMEKSKYYLKGIRKQVKYYFNGDERMMSDLGFGYVWTLANESNDQEAMLEVLETYRRNIKEYVPRFMNHGVPEATLLMVAEFYDELNNANNKQEYIKSNKVVLREEGQKELNAIYAEVIHICKLGQIIFQDNPAVCDKFTFSKILAKMNNRGAHQSAAECVDRDKLTTG